jgi:hypothetical protein
MASLDAARATDLLSLHFGNFPVILLNNPFELLLLPQLFLLQATHVYETCSRDGTLRAGKPNCPVTFTTNEGDRYPCPGGNSLIRCIVKVIVPASAAPLRLVVLFPALSLESAAVPWPFLPPPPVAKSRPLSPVSNKSREEVSGRFTFIKFLPAETRAKISLHV